MHLIWDWNGTLFDDHHIVVEAVNASLTAIGAGVQIDADGYRDHYRRPVRAFYDVLLERAVTDVEWEICCAKRHRRRTLIGPPNTPCNAG
jgi:phosphoglycolate phosphatase-like HAD superfamily hydrolase